ncbi:MAG: DUF6588 family protein [candidate division WOR-3 bacterium]
MKRLLIIFFIFLFSLAGESPVDKIKSVSEEVLKDYTQPLINSFGILSNTSLFHSSYCHSILGFDLSLKASYSPIPKSARYFSDSVLACSLISGTDSLVFFKVFLESAPTIFGPTDKKPVSVPGNAVAIPKEIPGGLNLPGLPYLIPQLTVGLPFGSEIFIRYIPWPFKGTKVNLYGFGLKENLNHFGPLKNLPVSICLGFAYQIFTIGDVLKTQNMSLNLIAGKRLLILEPTIGLGYEMTKVDINYQFKYKIPTRSGEREETKNIKVSFQGENKFRINLGCGLRFGLTFLHLGFEKALYPAFALTAGVSFR